MCSTQHPTNEVAGKLYSMKCDLTYTVCSSRCLIRELYNGLREDPEFMLYGFLVLMHTLASITTVYNICIDLH